MDKENILIDENSLDVETADSIISLIHSTITDKKQFNTYVAKLKLRDEEKGQYEEMVEKSLDCIDVNKIYILANTFEKVINVKRRLLGNDDGTTANMENSGIVLLPNIIDEGGE